MLKNVLINIVGINTVENDADKVEFTTEGKLGQKDGKMYILYEEDESIGAKGVKTMLKIENDKQVILQRSGALNSRMTIEKGQRHNCCYSTVQGDIMVGVFGESIKSDLSEHGGKLFMRYTVDVNMGLVSRNEIEISVKEVN